MDNLQPPQEETLPSEIQPSRNKVALQPGHSLMDWIRLTNSGKDLTGTGGRYLRVTPQMLSQHCFPGDAWIALRGNVYNVSHYMDYHPGGRAELMRGVGKDGTDLFNEIHRWVNFENMLKKCLVGKLVGSTTSDLRKMSLGANIPSSLKPPDPQVLIKGLSTTDAIQQLPSPPPTPVYEWEQSSKEVTVTVAVESAISEDHVVLDLKKKRELRVHLQLGPSHFYLFHLELQEQVLPPVQVRCQGTKLQLVLTKEDSGLQWTDLGSSLTGHGTLLTPKEKGHNFRSCKIRTKEAVTHDTFLYGLELPEGSRVPVAVGHHVRLRLTAKGSTVMRSYTPVPPSLSSGPSPHLLHFLIKIYPTGALTSAMGQLAVGEEVEVSDPSGKFEVSRLKNHHYVALLAAGTGFTPMVRVFLWLLQTPLTEDRKRLVKLVFFNKTRRDIIWQEQLKSLADQELHNTKLEVVHVLSEPEEGWAGPRGRVRKALLESQLPSPAVEPFLCVCGPDPFTQTSLEILADLGFNSSHTHAFTA